MALLKSKVNSAVRTKVGEVLWREGYFIIPHIGVSVLIKQITHVGPSLGILPRGKTGRKKHWLHVS